MNDLPSRRAHDPERFRYLARRFAPVLLGTALLNISLLFVDATKAHWVGAVSGAVLAVYLFILRAAADRKFTGQ